MHDGRREAPPLGIRYDEGNARIHRGDEGIRGAQIYADNLAHGCGGYLNHEPAGMNMIFRRNFIARSNPANSIFSVAQNKACIPLMLGLRKQWFFHIAGSFIFRHESLRLRGLELPSKTTNFYSRSSPRRTHRCVLACFREGRLVVARWKVRR